MTFFYLTNFSYVKTVLTIWLVSQFAIFKNRHVFADPITYSVTKILRKIRATTFTENYGKLRVRGMSAWDERTPLPISLGSATRYLFATR